MINCLQVHYLFKNVPFSFQYTIQKLFLNILYLGFTFRRITVQLPKGFVNFVFVQIVFKLSFHLNLGIYLFHCLTMLKYIAWYINIYIYNCFRKFLYLRVFVQAGAFDQKIEFLHHFIFRWIQRKVAKWTHPLPRPTFKWFEMPKTSFTLKTNISLDLHIRGCKTMTWTATIQFQWKLPKELLTKSGWIKGIS